MRLLTFPHPPYRARRFFASKKHWFFSPFSCRVWRFFTWLQIGFDDYSFIKAHAKEEGNCNAVVMRHIIMWSNTWSSTWSNTWPTNIIFLEANKPYSHYYPTCHRTYHPSSETSINPILITNRCRHWLATLVTRHGHYQLVDQHSETSTNIAIILIDAIYKEFYECWSRCPAHASAHSKTPSQTYESLIKPLACAISL